eukprot:Skav222459  [mRNA]  locus=scaffold3319:162744:163379:+ [translate_table: standard]
MLQTCASVLPATHNIQVSGVDYAAALLATCRRIDDADETAVPKGVGQRYQPMFQQPRALSFDSATKDDFREAIQPVDSSGMLQVQNALLHDARIKYWSVWLKGFRTSSAASTGTSALIRELQIREDPVGMSWQDIVQLLGLLPTAASQREESEDRSSFLTDPRTMSSMAYFRDPTGGGQIQNPSREKLLLVGYPITENNFIGCPLIIGLAY